MSGVSYSIVVPIYNDAYLAKSFCEQIDLVMSRYLNCSDIFGQIEVIFVNDGSKDNSLDQLLTLKKVYNFVRIINLSRNFGQHHAIACGYAHAKGMVVIRTNVDMQDHPQNIPRLLDELKNGETDIVIGQYPQRMSPWFSKVTAIIYFAIFYFLTGIKTPNNTSPLRAMSRRYIDNYTKLKEHGRFPQGLDIWMGFNCKYISIEHQARIDKRSSYNVISRVNLAIDGLLYFTEKPIKLVTYLGFILALIGFCWVLVIVVEKALGVVTIPGYASLMSLGLVAFGIQLTITGLLGLYTAKIFTEVKGRPLYIIQDEY